MIAAALDTSHGASLAIRQPGLPPVEATVPVRSRDAERELVPWLQSGLARAGLAVGDIRRWTAGTGPGSFSGVRTGIAVVKGICAVTGAAYRGVPSSVALALEASAGEAGPVSVGVLHDGRCGQVILSRCRWTGTVLEALGGAAAEYPGELDGERLHCDRYVTAQGELILPLLPESVRRRVLCLPTPAARWLLEAPGWGWPDSVAAMEASTEPVYVRPAVFVAPRQQPAVAGNG
jgi:tRNA A37 threonylcarbamoyladenosine modification protein TsaB